MFVNSENLMSKEMCFVLALINNTFRGAVCDYLVSLGHYNLNEALRPE